MASDDARADAPEEEASFEPAPRRAPWWASSRIRLSLLLTGLVVASFALISTRGGVLELAAGPSQATGAGFAPGCPGRDAPEVASTTVAGLSALHDAAARIMPTPVGRVYEQGTVITSNLWTDDTPHTPSSSPASSAPAGYEIRWWALDRDGDEDDVVADVFEFATSRQAREVLVRASSVHCRRRGEAHEAPLPSGGSELAWVNPDDAEEWDVLFVRGRRLYRVGDVPASYPTPKGARQRRLEALAVVQTVALLACALPDADCSAAVAARPPDLARLAVGSSANPGPVNLKQASVYAHAVNLRGYDVPEMTAVTREGTPPARQGYWEELVRCGGERHSMGSFAASQSPVFRYGSRLRSGFVSSTVTVFSSDADAKRYLAALASAPAGSCVARVYEPRLRNSEAQDGFRIGRIVAAALPAPAPASYRGLGPYRATALRLTIPSSYTTQRRRRVQLDSYYESVAFAYGRAVVGLAAESTSRPFASGEEQYLMRQLVGRAEAYEAEVLGPID